MKQDTQKKENHMQKYIKANDKINAFSEKHPRFTYGFILAAMTLFWLVIVVLAVSITAIAKQGNVGALVPITLLLLFTMLIQGVMNEFRKKYKGMISQASVAAVDPRNEELESGISDLSAEETSSKKLSKVTLCRAFIVILVITAITAFAQWGKEPPTAKKQKADELKATQSEEKPAEETETDCISKFIDEYNASAQTPIEKSEQFDPHDSEGTHYRSEFRLSAFDGSVGMTAKCGDLSVNIINYGSYGGYYKQNKSLRVYASGPEDQVVQFFRTAAPILDPKTSKEDVIEASTKSEYSFPGHINNSNITEYIQGGKIAETMLDIDEYPSTK